MPAKELPDPEYLRQRFRYEPETGKLYWRELPRTVGNWAASWNTRYAGREAFTADMRGYRQGRVDGQNLLAHRIVWAIYTGAWPAAEIDHINGDRADNRIVNLRAADRSENNRNTAVRRSSVTGVVGVTWDSQTSSYRAQIKTQGRLIYLGRFHSLREAKAVRKQAEVKYGFHPNHGRAAPA